MTAILFLLVGVALGGVLVYVWARERLGRASDKLAAVEQSQGQWEDRLKATTGDALLKSQASLLELTEAKLAPIKETLNKFEVQAKQLEERRQHEVSKIGEQLRFVAEGQEKLRTETGSLVTALRAPHVRGRWGELQLKRVVELAGMVEHCDFVLQASERDDEGHLLRPDMIINLAGGKRIVVDAKVPFTAYMDAHNADDVEEKRAHLARHAQQVRDHIKKLSSKRYWDQLESTPEFVVMFVDEGLYHAALDQDGSLIEAGAMAKVIVASPSTLIGLLRAVAYAWQQETVAESAREISALGRELYERLGKFAGYFAKVGRGLDTAVGAYNAAVSSFETRLLVTARKFPEHGVTNDELEDPQQIERKPVVVSAPELVALPHRDADAA